MSQHRRVATLAAPIPTGYEHDPSQMIHFDTAEIFDRSFTYTKIRRNYVLLVNALLGRIDQACRLEKPLDEPGDEWSTEIVVDQMDVVTLQIESSYDAIVLDIIGVRPCFVGHRMFLVVMYQLIRLACATGKVLIVKTCYPRTLAILKKYFVAGGMLDYDGDARYPDCVFRNHLAMRRLVTPAFLGISRIITEDRDGLVQLRADALPPAAALNDQAFVDRYFSSHVLGG